MYSLGIDLGGTNVKIGLVDARGNIVGKKILKTRDYPQKNSLIEIIAKTVESIIKERKIKRENLWGVGLAVPGPVDIERGVVHYFPNIKGFNNVPLKKIFKQRLNLPVVIENDANCFVFAEHKFGAGRGFKNIVLLTLGTGIGGGLILEGKLYRGGNFVAGEIGHIPINIQGPKCKCGGIACLERYVGNKSIGNHAKNIFKRKISLEELSLLAKKGNKKAIKIWQEVGTYLGSALTGIVNLLNPEVIILSGGVAEAGEVLFQAIRRTVKERVMFPHKKIIKILKARLKEGGIVGGALLARKEMYG